MYPALFISTGYMKEINESGDWNELRLRYGEYFSWDFFRLTKLFAKNQWRALKDVGFNTGNGFIADEVSAKALRSKIAIQTFTVPQASE